MKNKLLFLLLISILSLSVVSAADVAYIVVSGNPVLIKTEITSMLDNLSLSYDIVCHNIYGACGHDISTYNFSSAELIIINNDYFPSYASIPVNEQKAIIMNGRHIDEWGWSLDTSKGSMSGLTKINLDNTTEISQGFPTDFIIYDDSSPDHYYLDSQDAYDGIQIIGSNIYDSGDVVVGLVQAGTTLTKTSHPDTSVNADSIFFGITDVEEWSSDARKLFKNSIRWLLSKETYDISLNEGTNLISLPIEPSSSDIGTVFLSNPNIVSVKKYHNGAIVDATSAEVNQGYFLEVTHPTTLTINGMRRMEQQNVELNSGMNLLGIASLSPITLDSLDSRIVEVAKRNLDGTYTLATKYSSTWYNNFFDIVPGEGYWFKTTQQFIWSYNP
jgi:hypothetical protein